MYLGKFFIFRKISSMQKEKLFHSKPEHTIKHTIIYYILYTPRKLVKSIDITSSETVKP